MVRERRTLSEWILLSPVTWLITAVNLGVFIIVWARAGTPMAGNEEFTKVMLDLGVCNRRYLWAGEYWRLATAVILHWGIVHLLWNLYAMFDWCVAVERELGSWRFAVGYAASGLGASAVSALGHEAYSAGASGAGFGIIGVVLCILYRRCGGLAGFLEDFRVKQIFGTVAVWTIVGLLAFNMDHWAHFGGLFFGVVVGIALVARRFRLAWAIGAGLLWAGTLAASVHRWPWQD